MLRFLCLVSIFFFMDLSAVEKPNFLIIVADDCTYNDLPVYGGKNALTPNIDLLAKKGLTFNQAYLATAMCQPARSELYTGLYPFSNGSSWNHSASIPGTKSMPRLLGQMGYRVGIAGKVHVKPEKVYPFKYVEGFEKSCVKNETASHNTGEILNFMKADKAFCLVVCLVEPHVPWTMGDASKYPVDKLQLPKNIADTPVTRQCFSNYLAEITYMDSQVGDILKALDESGKTENTIVIFTSEQGSQFPGSKWTNWNTGLHTAFIASLPGRIPQNERTDALIQYADVLPTLIDIAGGADNENFDGKSFKDVLFNGGKTHRKYVYGSHNNVPEGSPYPIRSISNGKYRYILNLKPDAKYYEKHLMVMSGNPNGRLANMYWRTWVKASETDPQIKFLHDRCVNRPPEELYHTLQDSYEMNNLAKNIEYEPIKKELKSELAKWMTEYGDPGAAQDTVEAKNAASKGRHLYKPKAKESK